jgi:hypothetical protein
MRKLSEWVDLLMIPTSTLLRSFDYGKSTAWAETESCEKVILSLNFARRLIKHVLATSFR